MLLTNGCSFVWGDELEGHKDEPPSHWHLTFTHQLAEKLGTDYVNLGTCGGGNDKIFRDTMDYLRNNRKPSHIVILWSAYERYEHCEAMSKMREENFYLPRKQCMTQISPERTTLINSRDRPIITKYLTKSRDLRHDILKTMTYMVNIQYVCKLLDIKLLQGFFHVRMKNGLLKTMRPKNRDKNWGEWMDYIQGLIDELDESSQIGIRTSLTDFYSCAVANYELMPHSHPPAEAHAEYAGLLYSWFEKYYK